MTRSDSPVVADDALLRARLDAVCGSLGPMFFMNVLGAVMMTLFFWPAASVWLAGWLVLHTVVLGGRGLACYSYLKRRWAGIEPGAWPALLTGLTGVVGLSWGGVLAWMIATGTDNQIMFVVCVSLAAVSLAMASITYWPIYAAFQFPVTAGGALGFALSGINGHQALALGAVAITGALVTVSHRLAEQVLRAFRLAASNQSLVDSLAERGRELERAFAALEQVSRTDPLTGLANRRARDERLEREWQRAERTGALLTVIAIDVDRFKHYNDTHGHEEGDRALRAVAAMLHAAVRGAVDMAARHGGEEFMLILPGLSAPAGASVAERVRVAVAQCHGQFHLPEKVTVSLGVTTADPALGGDLRGLTTAADAALYRAKLAGRNRYESSPALIGRNAAA